MIRESMAGPIDHPWIDSSGAPLYVWTLQATRPRTSSTPAFERASDGQR